MLTRAVHAALPTFDIAEGALDKVLELYKGALPSLGGYLTQAGEAHLGRLEALLAGVAALEQQVLEERAAVRPAAACQRPMKPGGTAHEAAWCQGLGRMWDWEQHLGRLEALLAGVAALD